MRISGAETKAKDAETDSQKRISTAATKAKDAEAGCQQRILTAENAALSATQVALAAEANKIEHEMLYKFSLMEFSSLSALEASEKDLRERIAELGTRHLKLDDIQRLDEQHAKALETATQEINEKHIGDTQRLKTAHAKTVHKLRKGYDETIDELKKGYDETIDGLKKCLSPKWLPSDHASADAILCAATGVHTFDVAHNIVVNNRTEKPQLPQGSYCISSELCFTLFIIRYELPGRRLRW